MSEPEDVVWTEEDVPYLMHVVDEMQNLMWLREGYTDRDRASLDKIRHLVDSLKERD